MSSTLANLPWSGDSKGSNTLSSMAQKVIGPWTFMPKGHPDDAFDAIFHRVHHYLETRTDRDLVHQLQWDKSAVEMIYTAIELAERFLPDAEFELTMSVGDNICQYVLYVTSAITVPDLLAARAQFIDAWIHHHDTYVDVVHVAFRPRN